MKRKRVSAGHWTFTADDGTGYTVRLLDEPQPLWQAVDSRGSWVTTCPTLDEVEEYLEAYR